MQFSDALLLLLPVRSVRGTFAWVTSPYLIRRFARGAREAGVSLPELPASPADMKSCAVLGDALVIAGKVVFEDLDFTAAAPDPALRSFAERLGELLFPEGSADHKEWRQSLLDRLCLVHDDVISFLLDTATEVSAHIRLSPDTKTVERGALWYQESLPAESVLAGITVAADVKAGNGRSERTAGALLDHVAGLAASLVQLGGKATVGQGTCFVRIAGGRP